MSEPAGSDLRRDGESIVRDREFGGFAKGASHRPDILVHGCSNVLQTLTTHSAGGLTDNDFDMARGIDGLDR